MGGRSQVLTGDLERGTGLGKKMENSERVICECAWAYGEVWAGDGSGGALG